MVNLVFGMRIRDIDCAFKIFPRSLFDQIEMKSTGALIDAGVEDPLFGRLAVAPL